MQYSIIFMGTPEFSKNALEAIVKAGHNVIGVYTQRPKPVGRKHIVQMSAVHEFAESLNIPVHTPKTMRSAEVIEEIKELNPDLIIVAAYGFIIPADILNIPRFGCINIHASVLPRWRGAAPIQHAIMAGDNETGITIMKMDQGMDTGDIISIKKTPINADTTYGLLISELSKIGADMIVETLDNLDDALNNACKQPEDGVTIANKITKEIEQIDWSKSAAEIERSIRALMPSPAMWAAIGDVRMKILEAEVASAVDSQNSEIGTIINADFVVKCGANTYLKLITVQPAGKSPMPAKAFLNGHKNIIGARYEKVL